MEVWWLLVVPLELAANVIPLVTLYLTASFYAPVYAFVPGLVAVLLWMRFAWVCAFNVEHRAGGYLARVYVVPRIAAPLVVLLLKQAIASGLLTCLQTC